MSLLTKVTTTKAASRPRRVLIYGTHGIGKSTFGSCAPDAVFVPTEDGLQDLEGCTSFPLAKSFVDVMQALYELATEPHQFKTVVIDSVDWMERLIHQDVCQEGGKADISEFGFGKGYEKATAKWDLALNQLTACNLERNMMIVLVGHAKIEKFSNPETDPYDRYSPRLHKTASAILQEWCDEVFFANYKVYVKETDTGFNKTVSRGIGTGDRVIKTTERPSHMAKNRLNLPDELPLAFASYAERIPGFEQFKSAKPTEVKKPVKVLQEPSSENPF